jgi:hypothetical protein
VGGPVGERVLMTALVTISKLKVKPKHIHLLRMKFHSPTLLFITNMAASFIRRFYHQQKYTALKN